MRRPVVHDGIGQLLHLRMTRSDKLRLIRLRDELGYKFISQVVRHAVARLDNELREAGRA